MCITGSSASLSALSTALIVALVLVLAGCDQRLSRDEFASRVTGKSTSEVEAGIGKPDTVDESVAGTVRWIYNSKTYGIEGGTKFDRKSIVVFRHSDADAPARAVEVIYE